MIREKILLFSLVCLLAACTSHDYDTGDGKLSYMRADFALAHSNAVGSIAYIDTDEGNRVFFASPYSSDWVVTADSLYRVLAYYDATTTGTTNKVHSMVQLITLEPKPTENVKEPVYDPIKNVETAWISANGKFLNLGLRIMTGATDDDTVRQSVGMLIDERTENDDHTMHLQLRLFHNQNGVPEYYSSLVYISIPTADMVAGDGLKVLVNTYEGWKEWNFEF